MEGPAAERYHVGHSLEQWREAGVSVGGRRQWDTEVLEVHGVEADDGEWTAVLHQQRAGIAGKQLQRTQPHYRCDTSPVNVHRTHLRYDTDNHYEYSDWECERVRFNVPLDTLQVISKTVLQAITCTGTDNKN